MKRRLSIRPRADADIDEATAFLAHQSTVLAERFLDRVGDTLELIRDRPLL
ncbi:MAG: type II toxin-antitoxin system RelE/ParE family toxin [Phycisphaerales bacterium]|nr:type II toxin-antitoxin system RelE/ParE family toxin [Phycisphaerales bacterium]